ncbi:MAG: pantetheine-phosphate adenylyltransferase [Fusobacteriaceae bacterium]
MKNGVYSGSFDPITKGHSEIILRAAKLVEKLIVVVLNNTNKKYLFNLKEREEMVKEIFKNIDNIEVKSYEGLLVDFLYKNKSTLIIRGLRSISDYEYELTMSFANNEISAEEIETIFIPASKKYMYLSSTVVREIALNGGKLSLYLDEFVEQKVRKKIAFK